MWLSRLQSEVFREHDMPLMFMGLKVSSEGGWNNHDGGRLSGL